MNHVLQQNIMALDRCGKPIVPIAVDLRLRESEFEEPGIIQSPATNHQWPTFLNLTLTVLISNFFYSSTPPWDKESKRRIFLVQNIAVFKGKETVIEIDGNEDREYTCKNIATCAEN